MKYIGLFDEKEDIVTKEKLETVEAAIPTKTSQLDNDSGFITSAPVTSVNTKTGAVVLDYADVEAAPTIQGTELIKGTQITNTNLWTGVSTSTTLYDGKIIDYYLPHSGNSSPATLNLTLASGELTGEIPVKMRGVTNITTQYTAKAIIHMVYVADDNCWQCQTQYWSTYYSSAVCFSLATAISKTADFTSFTLKDNSWLQINMRNGNSAKSAITISIGGSGAKPIYINGSPSSPSNYELPAGTYFVFYDGTAYYFQTDSYLYGTVPSIRKVNNKELSTDITLSASDVGAQPTITVNGIIKGDGAGNLSAQDTVAAELVDLPTVPTKVSELENDANYITAAQAPVQSVNSKTGAVTLTASDVSAIPSTLTGTAGQVLTKTADGQEWKDAPVNSRSVLLQSKTAQMPSSSAWSAIAFSYKFVAVAANSNISAVSDDGLTWTQNTALPESVNWSAMTYGNYKLVAVASNSNVSAYASSSGSSWTATTLPASKDWTSIVCGDNKFIVVASNSNICAYSTDAINWTQQTLPATANWSSVTYGNGKFVAVATGTNIYAYSTDGVTWSQGTFPNSGDWTTVIYGGDKFVAVNQSIALVAYSTDGITWKMSGIRESPYSTGAYGGGRFVLVGNSNWFSYSNDGIDWSGFQYFSTGDWSVAYGDGKFVAIAKNSTDVAVTSAPWSWDDRVQRLYNFYHSNNHDVTDDVKEALQIDVSINSRLNRVTNINEVDNNYGVYMARGEALFSTETTPTVNGCIAWQYG